MAYAYGAQSGQIGQAASANALNQVKELGILQRADGLRSGLQLLRSRIAEAKGCSRFRTISLARHPSTVNPSAGG